MKFFWQDELVDAVLNNDLDYIKSVDGIYYDFHMDQTDSHAENRFDGEDGVHHEMILGARNYHSTINEAE